MINIPQIAKNLRSVRNTIREDFSDYLKSRAYVPGEDLSDQEKSYVANLKRDGYCIIPNFYSRERAFNLRDQLEKYLEHGKSRDFECGAYMRFWDKNVSDEGVRRIYHVDKLIPELAEFRENAFINRIVQAYYGFPMHSGMLVFQHNLKSNYNTRYYHVDWFGKQFKPFLYLDDVDIGNGPFTYLKRTHRSHYIRIKKQLLGNKTGSSTSFSEQDVAAVLNREIQICGNAGTLILADVRGLHRGSPQINRSRSVLVNYMYKTPGDLFLDK